MGVGKSYEKNHRDRNVLARKNFSWVSRTRLKPNRVKRTESKYQKAKKGKRRNSCASAEGRFQKEKLHKFQRYGVATQRFKTPF